MSAIMVCTKCGHHNAENDVFCGSCGDFLEWDGQKVEQAASPVYETEYLPEDDPTRPGFIARVKHAVGIDATTGAAIPSDAPQPFVPPPPAAGGPVADPATAAHAEAVAAEAAALVEVQTLARDAAEAEAATRLAAEQAAAGEAAARQAAEDAARREAAAAATAQADAAARAVAEEHARAAAQAEADANRRAEDAAAAEAAARQTAEDEARRHAEEAAAAAGAAQAEVAAAEQAGDRAGADAANVALEEAREAERAHSEHAETEAAARRDAEDEAAAQAAAAKLAEEQAAENARLQAVARQAVIDQARLEAEANTRAAEEARAKAVAEAAGRREAEAKEKAEAEARASAEKAEKVKADFAERQRRADMLLAGATPTPTSAQASELASAPSSTGNYAPAPTAGATPPPGWRPPTPTAAPSAAEPIPTPLAAATYTPAAMAPAAMNRPRQAPQARTLAADRKPGDLVCGQCGTGNDAARKFCRRCGNSLEEAKVEPKPPWWRRFWPFGNKKKKAAAAGGTKAGQRRRGPSAGKRAKRKFATALRYIAFGLVGVALVAGALLSDFRAAVINRIQYTVTDVKQFQNPPSTSFKDITSLAVSSQDPEHPAANLFDETTSYWESAAGAQPIGQTFVYAFGKSDPGGGVKVFQMALAVGPNNATLKDVPPFPEDVALAEKVPLVSKITITWIGGKETIDHSDANGHQTYKTTVLSTENGRITEGLDLRSITVKSPLGVKYARVVIDAIDRPQAARTLPQLVIRELSFKGDPAGHTRDSQPRCDADAGLLLPAPIPLPVAGQADTFVCHRNAAVPAAAKP